MFYVEIFSDIDGNDFAQNLILQIHFLELKDCAIPCIFDGGLASFKFSNKLKSKCITNTPGGEFL